MWPPAPAGNANQPLPEPAPTYVDHLGVKVRHDGRSPVSWRVSAYAVVVRDGALLMVEPAWAARWELPGGGVELQTQETLAEGARRECREETGYRFTPSDEPRLVGESFFFLRRPDRYCHLLKFAVRGTVDDHPDPAWRRDPDEISMVRWVPLASLAEGDVHYPHWTALRILELV